MQTGCEKQRSRRLNWAYRRRGLGVFIVWSSTADRLETILGVDVEGAKGQVWDNGEVWVAACVDGGMVEEGARDGG